MSSQTKISEDITEILITPDDLVLIRQTQANVEKALQVMGDSYRKLATLKTEAQKLISQMETGVAEADKKVSEAEQVFQSVVQTVASKYSVDLSKKCGMDLKRGVFTVG